MTPVISGTAGGQSVGEGNTIDPFANMTVSDANGFTTDTVTISLLNSNGQASDANGKLVLTGGDQSHVTFNEISAGVYALVDTSAPQVPSSTAPLNALLPDLAFIPASGSSGTTTTFAVHLSNTYADHYADDNKTTVTVGGNGGNPQTTSSQTTATTTPSQTASDTTSPPAMSDTTSSPTMSTGTSPTMSDTTALPTPSSNNANAGSGAFVHGHTVSLTQGDIDLPGLAHADSYSFKNDMLKIYSGGKVIDRLHFTADSTSAFTLEKTGAGVSIYSSGDTTHPTGGTVLPWHG